jgi:serine/threonine-protein kinase RsbW
VREPVASHAATLASDPLRLREARRWLARLVLEAGFAPSDAHDLAIAFSEACANVHRHAYRGRRDGRVGVRLSIEVDRVVLTLEHDGDPFDPAAYAPPDMARPAEGGYGLYLIESLVDDVAFERTAAGGRVVLVKRRRESSVHA